MTIVRTPAAEPEPTDRQPPEPVSPGALEERASLTAGDAFEVDATGDTGAGEALPRLLKLAGGIIAPASLLTGLLFHFGRLFDAGYFRFFHVNFTVLDLTTNDFLFAGVDGLFVPVAGATMLALILLWLHRLAAARMTANRRRTALRLLIPLAATAGLVLVGLAFTTLVTGRVFGPNSEAGGLCLALGTLALTYSVRLVRLAGPRAGDPVPPRSAGSALTEWGAAFLLVSIGLFWAVGNYAFGVGRGRAVQLYDALAAQPEFVVYSAKSLGLAAPGVVEQRCQEPDAAYRFRYTGLRLVRMAGSEYLLLPRSEAVRVEFRPPGLQPPSC